MAAAALGVGRAPKKEVASTAPKRALAAWRSHCGVASTATVGPGVSPPSAAANAPSRAASTPEGVIMGVCAPNRPGLTGSTAAAAASSSSLSSSSSASSSSASSSSASSPSASSPSTSSSSASSPSASSPSASSSAASTLTSAVVRVAAVFSRPRASATATASPPASSFILSMEVRPPMVFSTSIDETRAPSRAPPTAPSPVSTRPWDWPAAFHPASPLPPISTLPPSPLPSSPSRALSAAAYRIARSPLSESSSSAR